MTVFGKRLAEYARFEQVMLWLIGAVGLARLVLSLAGLSNDVVKWFSVTVVVLAGIFYCGVRVPSAGFGGYKHLLPLLYLQSVLAAAIVILGIVLARFGLHNIFAANEYGGDVRARYHILGHLVVMIVAPLVFWGLAALVMWITKKVGSRPAPAAA